MALFNINSVARSIETISMTLPAVDLGLCRISGNCQFLSRFCLIERQLRMVQIGFFNGQNYDKLSIHRKKEPGGD